ncbi:hypothetical protein TIFTF001_002162 [Ficus carica]|uniref:Uncharacterized protein n=1 Tax=Ficus carica TaxID=3494 RepID=A0AA87Z3F4_FICCA|nr:hypothetical protein TIFTF001_002162 [Ficus carica]
MRLSAIGVVAESYGVLERLEMVSSLYHLLCASIKELPEIKMVTSLGRKWWVKGVPPSGEPPDLERVSSFSFSLEVFHLEVLVRGFSSHGFLLFPGMTASGSGITLPLTV